MLGSKEMLEKRTSEFQIYLASMNSRAHDVAHGSCYMKFISPHLGESAERFIQFCFEKDCVHMDIPRQTLSKIEAAEIMASRNGFFYLSKCPEYTLKGEDVEGYDPFRAVYFYGDENSAADDMTHIFYSVWKISMDAPIYVTAGSFDEKHKWENDDPLFLNENEE